MRRLVCVLGALIAISVSFSFATDPCPQPAVTELVDYLKAHHQTPEEYVLSKFTDHDVVLLGEFHRIKHDQELVQRLIPLLYKNGIHVLGWEFAKAVDQPLIDSLLNGEAWNEAQGRKILFNFNVWGYQQYLDILKAAWSLNRTLSKDQTPFRIIGVNCDNDYSLFKTPEDRDNPDLIAKVSHGCTEANWAEIVLKEVEQGKKVLIHCGIHHAFTRYRLPRVDTSGAFFGYEGDERFGQVLYQRLGPRAFCISLHQLWSLKFNGNMACRPVNGMIDSAMTLAGPTTHPCGFDVVETPFGCLGDSASFYKVGYPGFRLADYCDGYIFQKPFGDYEVDSWIEDFVNESNVEEAKRSHYNLWYRDKAVGDFSAAMNRQIQNELAWYRYLGGK